MKITHVSVAADNNPMFLHFWPRLRRHYLVRFEGWEPMLTYVGDPADPEFLRMVDRAGGYDGITVLPRVVVEWRWQVPWAIFWAAQRLPADAVMLTMGIDQFPHSRKQLELVEQDGNNDAYFALLSLGDRWRVPVLNPPPASRTTPEMNLPTAYHVARAATFVDVFEFSSSWEDEVMKIGERDDLWRYDRPDICPKWGYDESYATEKLRDWAARGGDVRTPFGLNEYQRNRGAYETHYRNFDPRMFK